MTDEELKKLQKISLEMAVTFSDFCDRHGLLCYLCGGGCIGAVRDGKMIPWDDDLDFFMPRRDYEKALEIWDEEMQDSGYVLERPSSLLVTHCLFAKMRDKNTTYIYDYQKNIDTAHGVALDIIPLDGYPDSKLGRIMQCFWAYIYSLYCAQLIPQNHGRLVSLAGGILLGMIPWQRLRYKIWSFAKRRMTRYSIEKCRGITELCSGPGYMKNYYPAELFKSAIKVPFEDAKLPIPVGYDEYLSIAFGDYKKLPPAEDRVQQHDPMFMDLDKGYENYRGKQFLTRDT